MLKTFFKNWLINCISLAILTWLYNGIQISFAYLDFALAGFALTILGKLIKPIFDLVFLPINILTLGLFRWLRTAIAFAVLNYLFPFITISNYNFPGFSWNALTINSFKLSPLFSLVVSALLFNLISKAIRWIIKSD